MMIHHSAVLKDPPNVRRRYMSEHTVVMHKYLAADAVLVCMHLYTESRSYLKIRITVNG